MMIARVLLFLLFLCTIDVVWSFCENNDTILYILDVLRNIENKKCTQETTNRYNCPSLQAALNLTMKNTEVCNYFVINLQSGVHLITEPIVTNASVNFSNIGNGAVEIVCQFDAEQFYNQTGNLHSLYFNTSDSVIFENINFDHCPLPIRIFEADNVMIINSSFRYHSHKIIDVHIALKVKRRLLKFILHRRL